MDKENLQKSYMLIGPSGIGKSLISKELSKKTGLPVFSIDEIIEYTKDRYRLGYPGFFINERKLFKYYKRVAREYGPHLEKGSFADLKQNEMLKELTELFFYYRKQLDDFKEIKQAYLDYLSQNERLSNAFSALVDTFIFQRFTVNVFKIIVNKINRPVIFDMPCNFGWIMPDDEIYDKLDLNYQKLNEEMLDILNGIGCSILIEPGQDFQERTPERSFYFEYLFNNRQNYSKSDIIISSNNLFFKPSDPAIAKRSYFDAPAQIKREELLNKSELKNICDQILELSNALISQKSQ